MIISLIASSCHFLIALLSHRLVVLLSHRLIVLLSHLFIIPMDGAQVPANTFMVLLFLPGVIRLVLPLTWRGASSVLLVSMCFMVASCVVGNTNFHKHFADLAHVLHDRRIFRVDPSNILPAALVTYMTAVLSVWVLCLRSITAFKRNEMTIACAVKREKDFFRKNGLWLLA